MPTPFTTPIDIQFIVRRLRPGCDFHWKGDIRGFYAEIGDWRTPDIMKPTEAEVYAEWDVYLQEQQNTVKSRVTAEKIEAAETVDDLKALLLQLYQELQHLL